MRYSGVSEGCRATRKVSVSYTLRSASDNRTVKTYIVELSAIEEAYRNERSERLAPDPFNSLLQCALAQLMPPGAGAF